MENIKKIIEEEKYTYYGIRMDDAEYKVGDICNKSHQWWQDNPEDGSEYVPSICAWDGGELDGTCCFAVTPDNLVDVMRKSEKVFGYYDKMYLIAGDIAENGNDDGEIIIEDAEVLLRIK